MAQRERAVVVLDHEAVAGAAGQRLEPALEALQGGVEPAHRPADVQDADGFRARRPWRRGGRPGARRRAPRPTRMAGSSELSTMYWLGCVESRTSASRSPRAHRGELRAALLHLPGGTEAGRDAWRTGRADAVIRYIRMRLRSQ